MAKRRFFELGGVASGIVLVAFGITTLVLALNGRSEVHDTLARENIVGTPDSTIPGQRVDTGSEARAFADVIRKHTLEATGGQTYAEMPRFVDEQGNPTNDEAAAARDESGGPQANQARQIWITSTALTSALNLAYLSEQISLFGIVVGVALILTGVGFLVLALGGALRRREAESAGGPTAVPA